MGIGPCTLQGTACRGFGYHPAKMSVPPERADQGVRRSRIYTGLRDAAAVEGETGGAAEGKRGHAREDGFLRRALPVVPFLLSPFPSSATTAGAA